MPRGGKRPGAGASRGNTNAMKNGRHSVRFMAIARGMASIPEVNAFILDYRRRQLRSQRKAARFALKSLADLLKELPPEARKNNLLVAYLEGLLAKLENPTTQNNNQSAASQSNGDHILP